MGINRINVTFIAIALSFWNPISYYLLYRNSEAYQYSIINVGYWLVLVLGCILIYFFIRDKISQRIKNPIFAISLLGILFAVAVLINLVIGDLHGTKKEGLLFVPGTEVRYKSVEFDYTVSINSAGIRDSEFDPDNHDKFRIICVGDSWTIGWGVNLEDSYPKQLEKYLQSKGKKVEVLNCGQAGTYTTIYEKQLQKLVPVLKPNLVLVGVLQGDDLAQLYESDSAFNKQTKKPPGSFQEIKIITKTYLQSSLGNIVATFKPKKPLVVQYNWQKSATSVIQAFSPEQKTKFSTLQDTVQKLFRTGNLNPSLMHFYLNFPDRMGVFNNPNHSATRLAMRKMDGDLQRMKKTCDENNCKLVFVNMPSSMFTGHQVIRTPSDVLDPYYEANNKIDSMYHSLASKNNLFYIEMTEHFKSLPDKTGYFYRFDGHPNARGYKEIGEYIGKEIMNFVHNKPPGF